MLLLRLFNVSEPHLCFQSKYRVTSFHVARGLHRFTWTHRFCMMRTFRRRELTERVIIVIVIDKFSYLTMFGWEK